MLLVFSPEFTEDRKVRATETGSGEGKHFMAIYCLREMNNLFLGKYTIYNLKICVWNHCFDKLQQEIFYVFGNLGRENNNLEYSIEVVLKGSFRTSKVGIHHPQKQGLGGAAACVLISFSGGSDTPKVQDPLLYNDAQIITFLIWLTFVKHIHV